MDAGCAVHVSNENTAEPQTSESGKIKYRYLDIEKDESTVGCFEILGNPDAEVEEEKKVRLVLSPMSDSSALFEFLDEFLKSNGGIRVK